MKALANSFNIMKTTGITVSMAAYYAIQNTKGETKNQNFLP